MKNYILLILAVGISFFSQAVFAQNATITYAGSSLNSSSTCNVFNESGNNPTVSNVAHYPVSGGCLFDGTNVIMKTQVDVANNIDNGNAYALKYKFRVGYTYKITANVAYVSLPSTNPTAFPTITFSTWASLPIPTDTDPAACGPVSGSHYLSSIGTIASVLYPSQTAAMDYPSSDFSVQAQKEYLVITASLGSVGGTTVKIKKISITETPTVAFSLPASTSLVCGTQVPQTFTVSGTATPGITGYTWNLNYLPGSAIPSAQIPTASNTLTFTPDCTSILGSISATVAVGATNYNTNTSLINYTQPTLSLVGNKDIICSSETYSINNLPCNATVAWSTSGTGSVTPASATGPSVTLTKVSNGTISLTATVVSCGVTTTYTFPSIRVGGFTGSDITITSSNGTSFFCFNTTLSFGASGLPGLENRTWNTPSSWPVVTGGANSNYIVVTPVSQSGPPMATITFNATSCGVPITAAKVVTYSSSVCTGAALYSISPNPITNYGYIYIESNYPQTQKICAAQITDLSGNVLLNETYGCETTHYISNNGGLPSGNKVVRIYDGSQWYSYPLTVL